MSNRSMSMNESMEVTSQDSRLLSEALVIDKNEDDCSHTSLDISEREPDDDSLSLDVNPSTIIDRIMHTSNQTNDEMGRNTRAPPKASSHSLHGATESDFPARKIQYYQPSDGVYSMIFPHDPRRVTFPSIDFCKCTRSRCLMLYCDCFQAGQVCTPSCVCVSCKNTRNQSKAGGLRFDAIEAILWRRPDAFEYKPRKTEDGCKCKKNRCLKKYCDCFNMGIKCSSRCKCENCQNDGLEDKCSRRTDKVPKPKKQQVEKVAAIIESDNNLSAQLPLPTPAPSSQIVIQPPTEVSKKRKKEDEPEIVETTFFSLMDFPVEIPMETISTSCSIECIVPLLTEAHYDNLDKLIAQFCKVPFLSELFPPSSHQLPNLVPNGSAQQPIDLTLIRRRIKNRLYTSGRSVFMDVMSIISSAQNQANNTHRPFTITPKTEHSSQHTWAIASKADHLSEYFTSLWLEYMVPSDTPAFPKIYFEDVRPDADVPIPSDPEDDDMSLDNAHLMDDEPVPPSDREEDDVSVGDMCQAIDKQRLSDPEDEQMSVDDASAVGDEDIHTDPEEEDLSAAKSSLAKSSEASAKEERTTKSKEDCVIDSSKSPEEERSENIETASRTALTEMSFSNEKVLFENRSTEPTQRSSISDAMCSEENRSEISKHQLLECSVNLGESFSSTSAKIRTSGRSKRRPAEKEPDYSFSNEKVSKQQVERTSNRRQTRKVSIDKEARPSLKKTKEPKIPPSVPAAAKESEANYEQIFPIKLHAFIEEVSSKAPHILNWTRDGEAFEIPGPDDLGPFLTQFFSHSRYSSLQRQLNMYGFKKHSKGRYAGSFHHPLFFRDIKLADLSTFTRRVPARKTDVRKSKQVKEVDAHPKHNGRTLAKATEANLTKTRKAQPKSKEWKKIASKVTDGAVTKTKLIESKVKAKAKTAESKQKINQPELPEPVRARKKIRLKKKNPEIGKKMRKNKVPYRDPYIVALKDAYQMREEKRLERMKMLALTTYLPQRTLMSLASIIDSFVKSGCCVDTLDPHLEAHDKGTASALSLCISALRQLIEKLRSIASSMKSIDTTETPVSDYSINQLYGDLISCRVSTTGYPVLAEKIRGRIHRLLGKFTAPMFEISIRGVSHSSIWACAAAVVWAKDVPRIPYRPALVVGVLAPNNQKEEWHDVLTEVNESRLPEKLGVKMSRDKKKAESTVHHEGISYFLVEYIGTTEFSWVNEENILEEFDPRHDPNQTFNFVKGTSWFLDTSNLASYQKSVEEAQHASEEINCQMTDPCGDSNRTYA